MNSGKLLLGVLAGAATGALLGVLLAPDKGTATRQKISKSSGHLADKVKGKFNQFVDNISDEFSKVKDDVLEYADEKMTKDHEPLKVTKNF